MKQFPHIRKTFGYPWALILCAGLGTFILSSLMLFGLDYRQSVTGYPVELSPAARLMLKIGFPFLVMIGVHIWAERRHRLATSVYGYLSYEFPLCAWFEPIGPGKCTGDILAFPLVEADRAGVADLEFGVRVLCRTWYPGISEAGKLEFAIAQESCTILFCFRGRRAAEAFAKAIADSKYFRLDPDRLEPVAEKKMIMPLELLAGPNAVV